MRSLACFALATTFLACAASAHADGAPLARIERAQRTALEVSAGAGAAIAPRIDFQASTPVTFGFRRPTIVLPRTPAPRLGAPRLTPRRPIAVPTAFRGFGGFAARVNTNDLVREKPLVQVGALVEGDSCDACGSCDTCVEDVRVDSCGRVYEASRPDYVAHQSSYSAPTYRRYLDCGTCEPACSPCATTCEPACEPIVCQPRTRRVVRYYRPVYRTCYRPYYRSCYRPYYGGYAAPAFWNGLGWGLGVGFGLGWAYGW